PASTPFPYTTLFRSRIVGFQLDHGPYRHSQRGERILQRMKLREQRRLDPVTCLVARPKSITEGLDDVIGRHAEMRRPLLDHLQRSEERRVGKGVSAR